MGYFKKKIEDSYVDNIDDLFEMGERELYVKVPKELTDPCSQEEWVEACIDIAFWTKAIKNSMKEEDYDYKYFLDYN